MSLADFLKPKDLFYPNVFYEGEWILGGEFNPANVYEDYLLLNAKVENGVNCYQSFLEKNYYRPLTDILNSNSLSHTFFPKIVLTVNDQEGNRTANFAMSVFVYQQILGLLFAGDAQNRFQEFIGTVNTIEEWIPFLKQLLKEDRRVYFDVQQNRTKSANYGNVYQLYLDYVRQSQSMMSFDEFLDGKISASTKLLVSARYYPELFKKEIPSEELVSAFDYDTFCLVAAKSALDSCRTTETISNLVDNSAGYVKLYLDAVERVRQENPNYDCAMKQLDENGNVHKIRIQDIQREYEALLARHPEFSFIIISENEASALLRKEGVEKAGIDCFDFSKKDNSATLEAILKRLKEDRELAAEWEFIRKGSDESTTSIHHSSALYPTQALPEDEKIRRMIVGREYLENSDYVYKIYGIHKFEGYIGYIYPNGTVIFEKYYENIKTKKVASSSATYVMRLDNFMEMSKLSKTEIIRIIHRDSGANVKRIFHRENMERWKSDIFRVISGSEYTEEVMNYINALISRNDLKKSEVKS